MGSPSKEAFKTASNDIVQSVGSVRTTPSMPTLNKKPSSRVLVPRTPPGRHGDQPAPGAQMNTPQLFNALNRSPYASPDASPTPVRKPRSNPALFIDSSRYRTRENVPPSGSGGGGNNATATTTTTTTSQRRQGLVIPRPPLSRPSTTATSPSSFIDRMQETPALPHTWSKIHDRAICVLDARNYSLPAIVIKMRRTFPELLGFALTPSMIDKRLRILDQRVELDYWAIGLRGVVTRDKVGFTTVGEGSFAVPYGGGGTAARAA